MWVTVDDDIITTITIVIRCKIIHAYKICTINSALIIIRRCNSSCFLYLPFIFFLMTLSKIELDSFSGQDTFLLNCRMPGQKFLAYMNSRVDPWWQLGTFVHYQTISIHCKHAVGIYVTKLNSISPRFRLNWSVYQYKSNIRFGILGHTKILLKEFVFPASSIIWPL